MSSRLVLPFVCFLLGGGAGAFVTHWAGNGKPVPPTGTETPERARAAASIKAASSAETVGGGHDALPGGGTPKSHSLGQLLDDGDSKSLELFVKGLDLSEIPRVLHELSARKDNSANRLRLLLFQSWAAKDPHAAWKAALSLTAEQERDRVLTHVSNQFDLSRPDAAFQLVMDLGMGSSRKQVLRQLFSRWAKSNLQAAQAYLDAHPNLPVSSDVFANAVAENAMSNPHLALQQMLALPTAKDREDALRSIIRHWHGKDADATTNWALSQTDPLLREIALKSLTRAMANENPRRALEFLFQHGTEHSMHSELSGIIMSWAQKDPAAAFDYMVANTETLSNMSWVYSSVLRDLTQSEQVNLVARIPEGKVKNQVIDQLARQHIEGARYAQAVVALNVLPDSSERDSTLQRLGETWGKDNPQAAAAWLKHQPDSTDRDMVVAGYAAALAATSPMVAIQWAQSIPDEKVQVTTFKNIAMRWMRTNPQEAQAWLQSLNLPQGEKDGILRGVQYTGTTTFGITVQERR